MDDVIVSMTDGFWDVVRVKHPNVIIPANGTSNSWNLAEGVKDFTTADVRAIIDESGFFATLKAADGAINALKSLLAAGYDVRICTSPAPNNKTCVKDKYEWVRTNLGDEWVSRTIITFDKTTVIGDYLFDDKPDVIGEATPTWEHIVWTQPCNLHITGKRRVSGWSELSTFIKQLAS